MMNNIPKPAAHPWLQGKQGWLKNKERMKRRDRAGTLTDSQVQALIARIEQLEEYTKLDENLDKLMRMRDKALIALNWTFFKRGGEVLNVRIGDITVTDMELMASFMIEKKVKTFKFCPKCNQKNAKAAKFCRKCGENLESVVPKVDKQKKSPTIATKSKNLNYLFCKHVVEWAQVAKQQAENDNEAFLFPPYKQFAGFLWGQEAENHLTIQRFDQLLQRLDPTMTSSFFRYGHTEVFLRLGYSPYDLKEIGDWDSTDMPEEYAKRKGLTASQKKFSEDTRML